MKGTKEMTQSAETRRTLHTHTHTHTHVGCCRAFKQIGTICLAFVLSIFSTLSFADNAVTGSGTECVYSTLNTYTGPSTIKANWDPNTINLYWYNDEQKLTVQTAANTCNYDSGIALPSTNPTKTGYTFSGWEVIGGAPTGYTLLEYLESTGTQYIDTGVSGFNSGEWEIYAKWMITQWVSGYAYVFGVYEGENYNSYRVILHNSDNNSYYVSAKSKAGGGSVSVSNKPHNVVRTAILRNNSFDFDGQTYTAATTGTALPSANTMFLFSGRSGGNKSKTRIYSAWAKKDNVLQYNMIPVKRNSDSVLGMYDTVSGTFKTNAGTGTFTAGPAIQ